MSIMHMLSSMHAALLYSDWVRNMSGNLVRNATGDGTSVIVNHSVATEINICSVNC